MPCNICAKENSGYILPQPEKAKIISICDDCARNFFSQHFSSQKICEQYESDPQAFAERYKEFKQTAVSTSNKR